MVDDRLNNLERQVAKLTESVSILMADRITKIASEIAEHLNGTSCMVIRDNDYEIPKGYYCLNCFKKSGKLEQLWEYSGAKAIAGENAACMVCGELTKLDREDFIRMQKWNRV